MKRSLGIQLILIGAVLFGAIGVAQAAGGDPPVPVPVGQPPITATAVLINSGFEGGLLGWTPWFEDTGKPARAESLDYAIAPAFSVERNPLLVQTGEASLHIGRLFDPWHAGLKQIARVTPNVRVRFCAYGRVYASNRDFGHEASWAALNGHLQVGLAVGDQDWASTTVIWSEPINPHDEWREACAEASADASGQITVFTSANFCGVAAKHLDVWWDAARLTVSADSVLPIEQAAPLTVLLLLPTGNVSSTAYRVVPAQLYAGPIITLTISQPLAISQPLTTTLFMTAPVAISTPFPLPRSVPAIPETPHERAQSIDARPDPTSAPATRPSPLSPPVASGTLTPAPPIATQRPVATSASAVGETAFPPDELTPSVVRESEPMPLSGLLGLGALLLSGIGGAVLLVRRR